VDDTGDGGGAAVIVPVPPTARPRVPRDLENHAETAEWIQAWRGHAVPCFPSAADNAPRAISSSRLKKAFIATSAPKEEGIVANMVKRKPEFVNSDHCKELGNRCTVGGSARPFKAMYLICDGLGGISAAVMTRAC